MRPELSFVVPTDTFATIRRLVDRLSAQTVAERIELVVVCPARDDLGPLDGSGDGLAGVTVVEHPLLPVGRARAAGVGAAAAPIVVLGETHAFPAADWAEHVLAAHAGAWAGLAPGFRNANPDGALSWAAFLMDYGRFPAGGARSGVPEPPSYNSSYRRELLLAFDGRLGELLEIGGSLHRLLRKAGHAFGAEPAAQIEHLNVARPAHWLAERYLGGRLFAAQRARGWPRRRRLAYLAGSPLVCPIRLARALPALRREARRGRLPRWTAAALALGSAAWAVGEAFGYAAGKGGAPGPMLEYELRKDRYL